MSTRPLALFRCDGGRKIGAGHVMRCLAFADRLAKQGWLTRFAVSLETAEAIAALHQQRELLVMPEDGDDPAWLGKQIGGNCDLAVIDHYTLDSAYEAQCRQWAKRIFVIDDLADRDHDCDILADFTPRREAEAYRAKVPGHCCLLLGPGYAPLRREFFRARLTLSSSRNSQDRAKLLISLGATDPDNVSGEILEALGGNDLDISITVTLGASAPHLQKIKEKLSSLKARLLVDTNDMVGELMTTDLVIGAGGMSAWERCCLGKPTLMLATADNQRANAKALADLGAVITIKFPSDAGEINNTVSSLLRDADRLAAMGAHALPLCDGLGAARLALAANPAPIAKDGKAIALRPARLEDAAIMLEWQRHPATRRFARNPEAPNLVEHMAWMAIKLANPKCVFNIITHDGEPAGVLRFDARDQVTDHTDFEISVLTAPERYGLGIAGHALALGRVLLDEWALYAYVDPANHASNRLFERAGYERSAEPGWLVDRASAPSKSEKALN
jgi:UDP-2,4-diacetamido-2,4,6-trideoxy-beta-L-altropyranose hydrolase